MWARRRRVGGAIFLACLTFAVIVANVFGWEGLTTVFGVLAIGVAPYAFVAAVRTHQVDRELRAAHAANALPEARLV